MSAKIDKWIDVVWTLGAFAVMLLVVGYENANNWFTWLALGCNLIMSASIVRRLWRSHS